MLATQATISDRDRRGHRRDRDFRAHTLVPWADDEGRVIRLKNLPPGMICRPRGDVDDPDFNNMHVEIVWP